jgi:hypothetical protein
MGLLQQEGVDSIENPRFESIALNRPTAGNIVTSAAAAPARAHHARVPSVAWTRGIAIADASGATASASRSERPGVRIVAESAE